MILTNVSFQDTNKRKAFVVGKGEHGENAVFSYVEIELSNLVISNSKK